MLLFVVKMILFTHRNKKKPFVETRGFFLMRKSVLYLKKIKVCPTRPLCLIYLPPAWQLLHLR